MKARKIFFWGAVPAFFYLSSGCQTFHEDYTIRLLSRPDKAEVWKGSFFLGYTPYLFTVTATEEEDEIGKVVFPPVTLKKTGFQDQPVALDLEMGQGNLWECLVELRPEEEPET